ncbi:cytochrome P450 [Allosphingosinicella sp.]|jgi:cytochrome P450|uniref:cytochrome P450 n=1 Tax=Allosphingosinicella sp. TaxID=2823234 RepID=UPI002EF537A1
MAQTGHDGKRERFVPPYPPRGPRPVASWRGFFGERARTAIYGWSEEAYRTSYFRRKILRFNVHVVLDPDCIQRVLLDNASNYVKPDVVKTLTGPTIGRGLLTSDGALWRDQRKIVAASFAPAAVDALTAVFSSAAQARSDEWRGDSVRDMSQEATAATMTIIADALFSGDPRLKTEAAMNHIAASLESASDSRIAVILGLPLIGWTAKMRKGLAGTRFLRETLGALVQDRIADPKDDFLGKIVTALGERFEPDEAAELAVDNATTFYLAGHETTANAIAWTLFLLSEQPQLQERVAAEARASAGSDADDLPLLRRVIEESLRLYPPAPRFDRQAVEDDRLGGHEIRSGDIISIWPWLVHRHTALWDDPDAFDSDRFLPERRAAQHRFQYIPFGGGPRVCVGARFAMAEAVAVLASWVSHWSFEPVPGRIVRPSGTVTLKPEGGLPLRLARRS